MKQKSKLHKLHGADDQTLDQIAAQAPADWDMEQIFEKSYQKYLAQSGEPVKFQAADEITVEVKPARNRWMGILMTAACMAIACGTVGTMYFLHRSAPAQQSIHEQETQTVTAAVSETEAATEPEAETEAQEQTTQPAVTVPAIAESVPVVQTTAAVPQETRPAGTENAEAPAATQPAQQSPAQTAPAPLQTEPAATVPVPMETEPPQESDPGDTEAQPSGEPSPGGATPQTPMDPAQRFGQPEDTVFRIVEKGIGYAFNGVGPNVPLSDELPTIGLEGYTVEEPMTGDVSAKHYSIIDQTSGKSFTLHRFRWSGFYCEMSEDYYPITPFKINGQEAYHNDSYLFWNDGGGISMLIFSGPDELDQAIHIAENMYKN